MEEFSTEWFSPLEEGEERQNPKPPEEAHEIALPLRSVIVTIVLLKVA